MVSILLTVLKMIGITILIILGLILFILLLALFVPVRYRGNGSYQNGFTAKLRASWLLHMISIRGVYQNEQPFCVNLKIFGITIYDNLRADSKKAKHKKAKSTKNKTESAGEIQAASLENHSSEDMFSKDDSLGEAQSEDLCKDTPTGTRKPAANDLPDESVNDRNKKLGIVQKIKNILTKFVNFFKNIKFTFHKVCDTIMKIKDNINYYLKVLQSDSTKRALSLCQKQFMYILRKILPQKYRVNLHLGFDDPAVMGEVLAVWGMLYPLHQGNIDIQPEFEQTVMEGDFSFQGHVSAFVFVRAACILFFDKDIKRLFKHLRRSET